MNKSLIALVGLSLASLLLGFILISNRTNYETNIPFDSEVIKSWQEWKQQQNKRYGDQDYEQYRIQVFADNLKVVRSDKTGTLGITQFFDLTDDEFASIYLTEKTDNSNSSIAQDIDVDPTVSINWVTEGKVTPVKNQGKCGSCWTFSATGAIESALIISQKADLTIDLSEQQLIDCCGAQYQNQGCIGGYKSYAMQYVQQNSITTESNYPYLAVDGTCDPEKTKLNPQYHIQGYFQVNSSTNGLLNFLKLQPIAVSVDATKWKYYKSGVFSDCSMTNLNHAVLVVGIENGSWIVKNSWGNTWGEQGYIYLKNGNTCGLANSPYFPQI